MNPTETARFRLRLTRLATGIAMACVVGFGAAFATGSAGLGVGEHEDLGPHLVDGDGFSLYLFVEDDDTSTCYEECAETWPPLLVADEDALELGEGAAKYLVDTTERDDGSQQVTYGDWPLYRFAEDEEPGDTNGQGRNEKWYVVSPEGEPVGLEEQDVAAARVPFSQAQVTEGESAYQESCAGCHGADLQGSFEAPQLAGSNFQNYWGGRPVLEIFDYVSTAMPLGDPGGLSEDTYAAILAYVFAENGFESTGDPLSTDTSTLEGLTIPQSD